MYYRDANIPDISTDMCSDEDMGGIVMDFPQDSARHSKTSTVVHKSHKRPSAGALENTTDLKVKSFSHSKTLTEKYHLVEDWPQLGRERLGQVSGVALDSSGNVILFHRGNRTWDFE
jgi:hypothetical protein